MDAIAVLKKDHTTVKALFGEAEALSERAFAARQKLFEQIAAELEIHAKVEERIFYPAFKAKTKAATEERDEVLEAFEEHHIVKAVIAELKQLEAQDESYKPKLKVLSELVQHHIKEEETEMFKQARELLDKDELLELGRRILAMKDTAPAAKATNSRN